MSDQTIPSPVRLSRVESILMGDPALKACLTKKSVEVVKRNGDKVRFAPEVVKVATAISSAGKDPVSVSKDEVLKFANAVLNSDIPDSAPDTSTAASPEPKVERGAPDVDPDPEAKDTSEKTAAAPQEPRKVKITELNLSSGMFSLAVSGSHLAELDKSAGHVERAKMWTDLVDAYSKMLNVSVVRE